MGARTVSAEMLARPATISALVGTDGLSAAAISIACLRFRHEFAAKALRSVGSLPKRLVKPLANCCVVPRSTFSSPYCMFGW